MARALVELLQLPVAMAAQVRGEQLVRSNDPPAPSRPGLTLRSADDRDAAPRPRRPGHRHPGAANAVDWFEVSDDGRLVAVGSSEGGTEDSVLRAVDVGDGRALGEEIPNTRACSVAWEPDGSGFFYTRYPEGDQYHRTVHHHRLGDDWPADPIVWAEHPTRRRGRTSRCRRTGAGCSCTCSSDGAGTTSTSSTARPTPGAR